MKDKTTKNKDGSTTVVRETDHMFGSEAAEKKYKETLDRTGKAYAKMVDEATDPYPDSIPFDEYDQKPYADSVDAVPAFTEGGPADLGMALASLRCRYDRLVAHLVSKGYGSATIKRILAGEVVR